MAGFEVITEAHVKATRRPQTALVCDADPGKLR